MSASPGRTYEIHEVAALTGLQPARIRVWERRYAAVRPARRANGYRAYSAEQVGLLSAYARLVASGARIGDLVSRPVHQVLAEAEGRDVSNAPHGALLEAARALDREWLERLVAEQVARRGLAEFAGEVAIPLAREIGELWALGALPVAAEHLASEVVLTALRDGLTKARPAGPLLVAACLPGERHEWGILAAMAAIQGRGWRVEYLGPDLPVEQLLDAAWSLRPRAVGVSASDPAVVHRNLGPLAALASRLPTGVLAVAGGSGMAAHAGLLRMHGFRLGIEALPPPGE